MSAFLLKTAAFFLLLLEMGLKLDITNKRYDININKTMVIKKNPLSRTHFCGYYLTHMPAPALFLLVGY